MKHAKIFIVIVTVLVIGFVSAFLIVNWDNILPGFIVEQLQPDSSTETPGNNTDDSVDDNETPIEPGDDTDEPIQPGKDIKITISKDKITF